MGGYPGDLLACVDARWSPRIGDPTPMGWATVAAYALAAIVSATAWRRARGSPEEAGFWLATSLALGALAINKQLDLQSALTAIGRCDAQLRGWYADRRAVQLGFVLALVCGAVGFAGFLAWRLRRVFGRLRVAILGVAFLMGFVLVRAVGFHHFDELIGLRAGGWRLNWILELGGIALVAISAVTAIAMPRPGR